ncbi:MAG: adenosine deaminase [Pseudomonadota bacterium]
MHSSDDTFIGLLHALPKVELHNHLEGGAMYPDLALQLAGRNGLELPFTDIDSARSFYSFTSLNQFIDILRTTVATLNTAEDYADALERHGMEAARQNIVYHEIFCTYGLVSSRGVAWEALVEGIEEGRKRNREKHGVNSAIIVDLDRTLPAEIALQHVELAAQDKDRLGAVGLGLDCQERGYPAGRLKHCLAAAREADFHLTAHAGEDGGAASVWDALDCGVERIDHGVQCVEDPALMKVLAEREILLTVCPTSNVALDVFPTMSAHTLPALIEANIPACLNSDDPPMFDCNLNSEIETVHRTFAFEDSTMLKLLRDAIEHSFQSADDKLRLLQDFDQQVNDYQAQH